MKEVEDSYKHMLSQKVNSDKQTLLDKTDIKLLAVNEGQLTRGDIMRMHVKNYAELAPRESRRVYEKVMNQRSMHARKVFLKELNMLGWQFKNKTKNPDPMKAKLEELSQ
jgi:hypothetical protein